MTYEMDLETAKGDVILVLEISTYSPDRPANLKGHPDSWTPPENGDLEYEVLEYSLYNEEGVITKLDPGSFAPTTAEDDKIVVFLEKALMDEYEEAEYWDY